MANFESKLRLKYGLGAEPPQRLSDLWISVVQTLSAQGYSLEQAGRMAAQQLFPDFNTRTYASESDTIEALLAAAAERAKRGQ